MDVLPCQLCPAEIEVGEEDPDAALSDLDEHLGTHNLSANERFDQWLAAQLAVRPSTGTLTKRQTED